MKQTCAILIDTDRESSANFDRQGSATGSVLFLGLSPPKANKTVSFFVSFHRGASQSGILFLVSIERGGSRRVFDRGPLLSDVSQLGDAPRNRTCFTRLHWRRSPDRNWRSPRDRYHEPASGWNGPRPLPRELVAIVEIVNQELLIGRVVPRTPAFFSVPAALERD